MSPCLVAEVIEVAHHADVAVLPGALTPGEVFAAFRAGGDMVKVFPAQSVGGAAYLRALCLEQILRACGAQDDMPERAR